MRAARELLPAYGSGRPATSAEIDHLLAVCSMEVVRADISVPADVWPPIDGVINVFVALHIGPAELRYIKLHEIGHRLAGDLEEPTLFVFDGPLPESEEVADLFALVGILDSAEIDQGPDYVEERIRELVPFDNYGWQTYRVPRLARKLVRVKELVQEV